MYCQTGESGEWLRARKLRLKVCNKETEIIHQIRYGTHKIILQIYNFGYIIISVPLLRPHPFLSPRQHSWCHMKKVKVELTPGRSLFWRAASRWSLATCSFSRLDICFSSASWRLRSSIFLSSTSYQSKI